MQWRSGKAAGLTACKQQAERQSRALKFSLIPLKEGVWGIKGKKKKASFEQGRVKGFYERLSKLSQLVQ